MYRAKLRPWMYTRAAHPDEFTAVLPGDEQVKVTTPRTTRVVTIKAPVEVMAVDRADWRKPRWFPHLFVSGARRRRPYGQQRGRRSPGIQNPSTPTGAKPGCQHQRDLETKGREAGPV